jgi:hypothetical protein
VFKRAWKEIAKVVGYGKPTLILGDFNARHPELGDVRCKRPTGRGVLLLQACEDLGLTILNTQDCWQQTTRWDSVLDLALTTDPHLFALRIGLLPLKSDHFSLSITVNNASHSAASPLSLLPQRWRVSKADWEMYNSVCDSMFEPALVEVSALLNSLSGGGSVGLDKQATLDKAVSRMNTAFLDTARRAMPITEGKVKRRSAQRAKYDESLVEMHRHRRQYHRLKSKVRADTHRGGGMSSSASIGRRSAMDAALSRYLAASQRAKVLGVETKRAEWAKICTMIQDERSHSLRWRMFRRTVATGRKPITSITRYATDDVPASVSDSLNNFAGFWSDVMSTGPIPNWQGARPAAAVPTAPIAPSAAEVAAAIHAAPPEQSIDLDSSSDSSSDSDSDSDSGSSDSSSGMSGSEDDDLELVLPIHSVAHCPDIPRMHSAMNVGFTPDEVRRAAKSLRPKTAPGPDTIHARFLTKATAVVFDLLALIFNASWEHGIVPSQWKEANAFAIFKKGNVSDPSAYRLISITSVIARTIERLVNDRVWDHLPQDELLLQAAGGFYERPVDSGQHLSAAKYHQ